MGDLCISIIQAKVVWESPKANLNQFYHWIQSCPKHSNIIILPETFNTGFGMNISLAESMDGESVSWMKSTAKEVNAAICGSLIIKENGQYFNRFVCALPAGEVHIYDKRHLFSLAKENETFTAGTEKLTFSYLGWNICPLICYDLRFPVWSRNKNDTDILIYCANWPLKRIYAWQQLLIARAIENQCYVVGVNRVGNDGNDVKYNGQSAIITPMGDYLNTPSEKEEIITQFVLKKPLMEIRDKINFQQDADKFTILN